VLLTRKEHRKKKISINYCSDSEGFKMCENPNIFLVDITTHTSKYIHVGLEFSPLHQE